MADARVRTETIANASNICKQAITNFQSASTTLQAQCQAAGTNWNDEKYHQLKNVVEGVVQDLNNPIESLKNCLTTLEQLRVAIEQYEEINIEGGI